VSGAWAVFRGARVPHVDIIGRRRIWFLVSGALLVASVVGLFTPGLKLSIDFRGGAVLRSPNPAGASVEEVRSALRPYGRASAAIQVVGGGEVSIRTESLGDMGAKRAKLLRDLAGTTGVQPEQINIEDVGPSWGAQILRRMIQALVIFLVLVTIYIAFRFDGKMAASALAALFHDVVITAGVYALLGREVTPETVIAILTILGYSLYDTVVIFDKVQENLTRPGLVAREGVGAVINLSLNQAIMRSINTSLSTALPVVALWLFGGETLKDFAFALLVGVLVGTYSSIFVAAPVFASLRERERPERARRRSRAPRADAPAAPAEEPVASRAGGTGAGDAPVAVQARPRKKRSTAARKKRRRR
jgi:preprotein translocase SecF subunit